MNTYFGAFGGTIAVVTVILLVILLIRQLVCWYFKINLIHKTLETISAEFKTSHSKTSMLETEASTSLQEIASILISLNQTANAQLTILKEMQAAK